MSGGSIGKIAGIALPIAAGVFAPELIPALTGVAATAGTTAALTGAAGAAGGLIAGGGAKGALIGGALGAAGGYLSTPGNAVQDAGISGLNSAGFGNAAYDAAAAEDAGSGLFGSAAAAATGGAAGAAAAGGGALSKLTSIAPLLASGVQYASGQKAIGAEKAALATQEANLAPYNAAGKTALNDYQNMLDPNNQKSFIQSNPLYNSLADDAARRLTASNAAEGKFGTGGTSNALQTQLLNLGNGLVQQRLGNDQSIISGGQNAAAGVGQGALSVGANVGNINTQQGNAVAGGVVGAVNTGNAQYQNSINTLLALQNLKASNIPQYQVPALNL